MENTVVMSKIQMKDVKESWREQGTSFPKRKRGKERVEVMKREREREREVKQNNRKAP